MLLGKLWGNGRWFLQAADKDARGIHLIRVLRRPAETDVVVGRLRAMFQELELAHASLAQRAREAGMRTLSELEIFPNPKCGFRLPFAAGRSLIIDRPLDLITYRGKQIADVASLWRWCNDDNRQHMPKAQVMGYVVGRLEMDKQRPNSITSSQCERITVTAYADTLKMKGKYRQFLTEFWSGKNNLPDTLNKGIRLLTLMAPHYFPDNATAAVRIVEQMIDDLPDCSFSSRMSNGNREAVSRVVRHNIETAFHNSNESSKRKLEKTFQAWKSRGFNPFDNKTWTSASLKPTWKWLDGDVVEIGKLSTVLKCDADVAEEFLRQLIQFVATSGREMSLNYVKVVMRGMNIKVGSKRENKPKQIIDRLIGLGWLYVRAQAGPGRARAFGLGEVMKDRLQQAHSSS